MPDNAPPNSVPVIEETFTLDPASSRFDGHFEQQAILPAVAQLSDLILPAARRHFGGGALKSLSRVKWSYPLMPGTKVRLILSAKGSGIRFELYSGEHKACTGSLKLESSPTPDATT